MQYALRLVMKNVRDEVLSALLLLLLLKTQVFGILPCAGG
jgi:hypothetical protein